MTAEFTPNSQVENKKRAGRIGATSGALIAAVYAHIQGTSLSEWDWDHLYSLGLIVFGWVAARYGLPADKEISEEG